MGCVVVCWMDEGRMDGRVISLVNLSLEETVHSGPFGRNQLCVVPDTKVAVRRTRSVEVYVKLAVKQVVEIRDDLYMKRRDLCGGTLEFGAHLPLLRLFMCNGGVYGVGGKVCRWTWSGVLRAQVGFMLFHCTLKFR